MDNDSSPAIMFLAGDPSGDEHSAPIVRRLLQNYPDAYLFGVGGPAMTDAGFHPVLPFEPFNRMGFSEVISGLAFFLRARRHLRRLMVQIRPKLLVCVDFPGFNLIMMKMAHKLSIPVVWYIAPKVWAWKKKRAGILGKYASSIAVIFPFETKIYEPFPADCVYVGNPLVESRSRRLIDRKQLGFVQKSRPQNRPWRVALVPGSRRQEIASILPAMVEAVKELKKTHPDVQIRYSRYGSLDEKLFASAAAEPYIAAHTGDLYDLLVWADTALVTSGTATLQTALMGVPFVLVYKTSALSYFLYKQVVTIPHVGLPNIIAGKEIIPECLQQNANPQTLAGYLRRYIDDTAFYENTVKDIGELQANLGEKITSEHVADLIQKYIETEKR
ncbi:MAG: lipid-A-disaccharide synthase [Chitinivibrionales bacterium]